MREFVVTLRSGKRYTVRADRVAFLDQQTVGLVADPDQPVAVFDRDRVVAVIAADHLVSEADEPDVVDPSMNVPF